MSMHNKGYVTGNPMIDKEVAEMAKKYGTPQTRECLRQLFMSVVKLHLDHADDRDLYLANVTLKELRHIFRTFARYRDKKKVVIFGSHRIPAKSKEYKMAEEFSREIVKRGYMVITGGGGGVMEAGNKGAGRSGFAVKIRLPLEMEANQYVTRGEKLINVKYFFTRKLAFMKESDATVLFPGGFGTHDEGFEVLTLIQTGKALPRPVVMVEKPGGTYWKSWLKFIKNDLIKGGYLTKIDLHLFRIVRSVKEAIEEIENYYRVYHSIKFSTEATVIRLNEKISAAKLKRLSKKYKDIILSGEIRPSGPLSAEVRGKEHLGLPRICLDFDRKSYPRLVELIRDINRKDGE